MKPVWIAVLFAVCGFTQTAGTQSNQSSSPAPPIGAQVDNSNVRPEDKCSIEGKVLNAVTGQPLKKAHLSMRRMDSTTANAAPYGAVTDAAGHFTITNIDPGRYHISADRNGFVRSDNSPKKLKSVADTLTLAAAQKLSDVQIQLTPHAVIAGRVVDEDNEPVAGVRVQCARYRYINGRKTLIPMSTGTTNDKGEYRAYGLPSGKYFVSAIYPEPYTGPAEIRNELTPQEGYVPTYYPSALDPAAAMQVDVGAGAELAGVDIRLVQAKTFHISGVIENRSKTSSMVQMILAKHDTPGFGFDGKRSMTDAKGHFIFRGVMPGAYDLQAMEFTDDVQHVSLLQVNVADSNIDGLQLMLGVNPDIKGALVIENAPQQQQQSQQQQPATTDAPSAYRVFLSTETNNGMYFGSSGGEVKDDGTFTLKNVAPIKYRASVYPLQEDSYVKQVVVGDKESADGRVDLSGGAEGQQIKVVINANGGHIEGSVNDAQHQPSPHATVVLVPDQTDATQRYKTATTDQNGHYVLRGVTPGKYGLYAFDQVDQGGYFDPDYMKPFTSKAETIEITEGSKLTHDLQLIVNDEDSIAGRR